MFTLPSDSPRVFAPVIVGVSPDGAAAFVASAIADSMVCSTPSTTIFLTTLKPALTTDARAAMPVLSTVRSPSLLTSIFAGSTSAMNAGASPSQS